LPFHRARAAVAGADGVDEDEVGLVEQRVFVFDEAEGGPGQVAHLIGHGHALRAEQAHVQPDGGGAGAAVEAEGDGPGGEVAHPLARVGDVKEGRARLLAFGLTLFFGLFLEHHRAGGGGVADLLAADGDRVLGGGDLLFDLGRRGGLVVVLLVGFVGHGLPPGIVSRIVPEGGG
jgi:hypothetical protein